VYRKSRERQDSMGPPSVAARMRAVVVQGRDAVIRLGLHRRPIVGRLLKGIDRWLP
jgi:hypothetical protein